MADAVRINGLRDLRRDLKSLQASAPRELNKALRDAVGDIVLPAAQAQTPRRSGRLASSNKVTTRGDRVVIRNRQPYANTIHWGRLENQGRPSVVAGRPFLYATLMGRQQQIGEEVLDTVERFFDREIT